MSSMRDELVARAQIAEQANRHADMVHFMRQVAEMGTTFSHEERNLFSVAYKVYIGDRRSARRAIRSVGTSAAAGDEAQKAAVVEEYLSKIEGETRGICDEVCRLIDSNILPTEHTCEGRVFFLKMKGDYKRYLAEFAATADKEAAKQDAEAAYSTGLDSAMAELAPTHPVRLGLALNFAVFHFEVMRQSDKACSLARAAFDAAVGLMDSVPEDQAKDAQVLMQLLKENLALWTADLQRDGVDQDGTAVEDFD
mmetsp:Transcript_1946/g.2938  ORF Transcript_1946/g.2938 Transcript_1946/m.2938 type:complete len:253 (-) Transcript_1946:89-847(-)